MQSILLREATAYDGALTEWRFFESHLELGRTSEIWGRLVELRNW